jgi:hypothetical protein
VDRDFIAASLKRALEHDGEADPDAVLDALPEAVAPHTFDGLLDEEDVESRQLASFVWDGGGAPMSSFLSINAVRLGEGWFIYFHSDDFETKVLDHVALLDAASATGAVEAICGAHEYVGFAHPVEIELDDLVDRPRVEACFDDGKAS